LGSWCFGALSENDAPNIGWAALAVGGVCLVSLLVAIPKVRAVRVIA